MKTRSYLLAIDGSQASRSAAQFAWDLAKQTSSKVVAQHVVDTAEIWRFLAYDLAGFIGSGLYMDARERITEVMYSIA
ncbi:universal stress protein, partial [bacterium]|nr:universal stress protein [bacterium]